ncbi:MAG: hypothetical protein US76_01985 [Parcubacteria group bacterium GW2011_GWA2_38_13b]|nr:MAG: hypothetical protein US76_01985 [Parcubacteria group bacterium GW2011_GWA2_38_13b]
MNTEKFYQFLATMAIGFMLILAIGDRWDAVTVFFAIQSFSSFFGVFLGIAGFVGRIKYRISIPYYIDFLIFVVGSINVANKFFALF